MEGIWKYQCTNKKFIYQNVKFLFRLKQILFISHNTNPEITSNSDPLLQIGSLFRRNILVQISALSR